MTFFNHIILFLQNDLKKLKRKWISLPLLLLFPIIIVALCAVIAVSIFSPNEKDPIQVGLVDLDQSKETKMVINLIEESSQLGNYIQIKGLTKQLAKRKTNNVLSAYITFPEGFTEDLYNGTPVTLYVTGNPNKRTNSYMVKELLDSIARHIRTSQANILAINHYAKQLPISESDREDMLFQQFTNFLMYTIGKDKIIDEEQLINAATSSPLHYYLLSGWFIIVTIWLLSFYSFFTREDEERMKRRMALYGVTTLVQLISKMITVFMMTAVLAAAALYICVPLMNITLYGEDMLRISIITGLYSITFLTSLAMIEKLLTWQKVRVLMQVLFTLVLLLASGAILPTLYFPLYIQNLLPYVFASETFYWLQEILLNNRLYADFIPLSLMAAVAVFLFFGLSILKERGMR
ncbi:ABC transporter permease [Virgibacillus ihumii]|uniref:ABC transporter permease n=1 Tax=Virgibacillus ihumii TaxID=2686091 RepID=UPI00157C1EE4|nr:ABC transporter permease [Virgibacillus ihumii]